MKRHAISHVHRARLAGIGVARRSAFPWAAVATLGSMLAACASFTGADRADTPSTARLQDGPVFEGSAPGVPGSYAKLVLEKNFQQTRKLRWQSADARIGSAEVDFFEPRKWKLEGDPPDTLTFEDRSPGPVLAGTVLLAPYNRAVVTVVLGKDRVKYMLDRVERNATH